MDLDETLLHSSLEPCCRSADINIKIEIEGKITDVYVLKRFGVEAFIEKMSKLYEVIIFTASLANVTLYLLFRSMQSH